MSFSVSVFLLSVILLFSPLFSSPPRQGFKYRIVLSFLLFSSMEGRGGGERNTYILGVGFMGEFAAMIAAISTSRSP